MNTEVMTKGIFTLFFFVIFIANFRFKTGHDCLAAHLQKNGTYESSDSTTCQMPNSTMDK